MHASYEVVGASNLEPSKRHQMDHRRNVGLHAVKVMETLGTGTIAVLIRVDDRRLTILQPEDGQPANVIAEIQRETKLDVCDHEEAAARTKRTVSIMKTQWCTLTQITEVWDLQVGEQVEVQYRSELSESTRRVMGEVLQKPDIRDDELHLNERSIKMEYIVQVCRKGKEEGGAKKNAANEGLGPRSDFEQEHQNQPHFRPTRRRIDSDEESVSIHSSDSTDSEERFESKKPDHSKSRARSSPSRDTRVASPAQSMRRSPSAAGSRGSVANSLR